MLEICVVEYAFLLINGCETKYILSSEERQTSAENLVGKWFPDYECKVDCDSPNHVKTEFAFQVAKSKALAFFSQFPKYKKSIPRAQEDLSFSLESICFGKQTERAQFFERTISLRKLFEVWVSIFPNSIKETYYFPKNLSLLECLHFWIFSHPSKKVLRNLLEDVEEEFQKKEKSSTKVFKNMKEGHYYTLTSMEECVVFQHENKVLPSKVNSTVLNSIK